jgi:hypothetical protein
LTMRFSGLVPAPVMPTPSGCCSNGTRRRSTTTASAAWVTGPLPRTSSRSPSWRRGVAATRNYPRTRCCRGSTGSRRTSSATVVGQSAVLLPRSVASPRPQPEPAFSDLSEQRLDDERRMRRALALLAQLSQHEQDVVALCVWSDVSYQDAALALGIPVGTVRSRLSRRPRSSDDPLYRPRWRSDHATDRLQWLLHRSRSHRRVRMHERRLEVQVQCAWSRRQGTHRRDDHARICAARLTGRVRLRRTASVVFTIRCTGRPSRD